MPKPSKPLFVCQSCGFQSPKWLGRCPDCGQWNALVEEAPVSNASMGPRGASMGEPQRIETISLDPQLRVKTGMAELDRTLGGGLVPGSLVLVGGEAGIGKSTLVLP